MDIYDFFVGGGVRALYNKQPNRFWGRWEGWSRLWAISNMSKIAPSVTA